MYLAVFSVPLREGDSPGESWQDMIWDPQATFSMVAFTQHHVPEAETFNLLGDSKGGKEEEEEAKKAQKREADRRGQKPVTHLRSKMTVSMMTDEVRMPVKEVPPELHYLLRRTQVKRQ